MNVKTLFPKAKYMFWKCPKCREINVAPSNQNDDNVVGCSNCELELKWKDVKTKW